MNIIQKQPNPSGAYPPIQTWSGTTPPETHYEITADISEFYNGFIIPTVEGDKVTSFVCNTELRDAWLASLPEPTDPEPTTETDLMNLAIDHEYRLTILELGV